jgi:hypothetical protein
MSSKYHDFLNVFFKKKADILSSHRKYDHRIKLEKDDESDHEYASLYNLSEEEKSVASSDTEAGLRDHVM